MKKSIFGKALAFLAAGAMIFTALGCDTGDDSYLPENPTTWYSYSTSGNGTVTAKWTFSTDTSSIGASEVSWKEKEIAPDEGKGATLTGGDPCIIKWVTPGDVTLTDDMGESAGRIQAANKTASLKEPKAGASLILITEEQTNITVRAKGAGAATSARILAIYADGSDTPLVYKDNLFSAGSKFIAFHLQGAPAGKYTIYFNGSTISEIDTNSTGNNVVEPRGFTSNDELVLSASPSSTLESLIDTHTFTLKDKDDNDLTPSAVWTLLEGDDIATISGGIVAAKSADSSGKVKVRARMGRFYQDSEEFEFKAAEKGLAMTLISSNLPAKDTKILNWNTDSDDGADAKKVLTTGTKGLPIIEMVDNVAKIKIAEPLQNIHVKETGNYALSEGVYTLTADTQENPASEFWVIKDIEGTNPGLHVKDDSTKDASKAWANNDKDKTYVSDTELYSISYKVKPASGKNPKISGVNACINGGKGAGNIYVDVYMGDTKLGRALCTKNTKVSATTIFESSTPLTAESTITFKVGVVKGKKGGQSVQIMNLGLVCIE